MDFDDEGHEGANKKEQAKDKEQAEQGGRFFAQHRAQEKRQHENRGKERACRAQNDRDLDEARSAVEYFDLMFEMAPVVACLVPLVGLAHFLQQLARTVHGAREAIGEREQQQAHPRDQNDGAYRYLQQRDELTKGGCRHGPIVYPLASADSYGMSARPPALITSAKPACFMVRAAEALRAPDAQ